MASVADNMEKSIPGEENHQACHSDLVSKCVGSSIKIDSISIDLVSNNKTDAGKCEHFSIRGFVSEVRKKNWKLCWPFALDGNHNKTEEICTLPPLHVSKFRWWRCQNCLLEMGAEVNCGKCPNYCGSTRFNSTGTRSHVSSLGDAAMVRSDFDQVPNLNIVDGRKFDVSIVDLNVSDLCPPSLNDKNGKKYGSTNIPFIGHEIGPVDKMNLEVPISVGAITGGTSGLITGRCHAVDRVLHKTSCNGSAEFCNPDCGSHEAADMELANEKLKCMFTNSVEICQTEKQSSAEERHPQIMISCGTPRVVGEVDEVLDAANRLTINHPSPELDMCGNASSESEETLSRKDLQDHYHDNSSGSHRRKTRKVRLLTELLAENGDAKDNLTRNEDSPSNSIPNSSARIDGLSALQVTVPLFRNTTRDLDQNKKRRFPHDEEQVPLEIMSNNLHKKNRTCNESAEIPVALASLNTEEDAGVDIQMGSLNQFRFDRSPIGKKKNKSLVLDEFLSLAPSRENFPEDIQNIPADANKVITADAVLFRSAQTEVTSRGMNPFPLPPQKTERDSTTYKKSKMPQFDDGQASLIPWSGMLGEGPVTEKDVEMKEMRSIISPFQSSQDATTGKGLDLSLNSCFSAQGYDRKYISSFESGQFPWQAGSSKENGIMGKEIKRNCVRDSDYHSESEADVCPRKGVHCDLSRENYRMSFLNDKQKSISQVEAVDHSRMQPLGFCKRESIEMQEHSALTLKPSDQHADKVSEQGVPDDIPMEIVELMAKNQYERCLPDGENERPLETTVSTSSYRIHTKKKLSILVDETACKPKPRTKHGRNGKIARAENEGTSKQKSVDCFSHIGRKHFNLSPLEQAYAPAGFVSFPQCQEKPPNKIKFSETSSSKHNSSQNCQWFGNILGHRTTQTNLQALGACNSCQSVPQQSKDAVHLWPSMLPSRMPFIYNNPQKHPSQSTNTDVLPHCPSLRKGNGNGNHNLNFLNVDVSNIEKHNRRTFDSESVSKPHAEYPFACKHSGMGSLDLYSNETIPAMHLLSLMDAGLPSGAPIDIDGNHKFLKRPFRHDNHSNDISGLPSGGCRITNATKPLPYDYYGKNHLLENSHECFPAIQTVDASGFSFQHDKVVKKTTGFTGQPSLKSQERAKAKVSNSQNKDNRSQQSLCASGGSGTNRGSLKFQERDNAKASNSSSQNKDHGSQQSMLVSGHSGTNQGSIHVHNMQKMFVGSSGSIVFPLQFPIIENATKQKLDSRNITTRVLPSKNRSKTEMCCVNRNPADFSMPEAGNVYMIRGEDLKFRKPVLYENRSGSIKLDRRKRQKKLTSVKGKV